MNKSVCILGRQPGLGLAELESLYGADKVTPLGRQAALLNVDPCLLAFDRLGGSVKFAKLLTVLDTTSWDEIEQFLVKVSPEHSKQMPDGKLILGLSVIGLRLTPKRIQATGLAVKKVIKTTGRPVRLVPNQALELNSAQVIHNNLTGQNGWELYFIRDGNKTVVAQTCRTQDIEAYGKRDHGRPKRDAKVGMLPPKLAQTILNLAVGQLPEDKLSSICDIPAGQRIPRPVLDSKVLDPFCGTGVVLQEALLMGYNAYGTDIDERMIEYSRTNLDWLTELYDLSKLTYWAEVGDATSFSWQAFDTVACETYLGRPFSTTPPPEVLSKVIGDVNAITEKFLKNLASQTKPGFRACLAVPAWHVGNSFKRLPTLDHLAKLGYTRAVFKHVRDGELIYHREGQIVARELVVLIRK